MLKNANSTERLTSSVEQEPSSSRSSTTTTTTKKAEKRTPNRSSRALKIDGAAAAAICSNSSNGVSTAATTAATTTTATTTNSWPINSRTQNGASRPNDRGGYISYTRTFRARRSMKKFFRSVGQAIPAMVTWCVSFHQAFICS